MGGGCVQYLGKYIAALHAASMSLGASPPPALRPVAKTFVATAAAILADTWEEWVVMRRP